MKPMPHDFIDKRFDSSEDRHAKKNRDNTAAMLREQGYNVSCSRTTNLRGRSVYLLDADKDIIESKKEEGSIHV